MSLRAATVLALDELAEILGDDARDRWLDTGDLPAAPEPEPAGDDVALVDAQDAMTVGPFAGMVDYG